MKVLRYHLVPCMSMDGGFHTRFANKYKAIEVWNRRADNG